MVEGQTKDNICKTLSATLFLKSHPPKRTLCHLHIRYMIKCDKNFNTVILLLFLPVTTIISRKRLTKLNSIESPCNLRWPSFRNVTVTPPRDTQNFWEDGVLKELGKMYAVHRAANSRSTSPLQLEPMGYRELAGRVQGWSPGLSSYSKVFKPWK